MNPSHPDLISWAASYLRGDLRSVEQIVDTKYSLVLKLKTEKDTFYLKQTPESLFIESAILDLLMRKCGVDEIPVRVTENREMRCFITQSCGDEPLRKFFAGKLDRDMLGRGVTVYANIQHATVPHIQAFLDAGVPDWRMNKIPLLYEETLEDRQFLEHIELPASDARRLKTRQDALFGICDELAALEIPDTLNHSDFQNNNILIDHSAGRLTIIDWGETHIGNPLLSRHYCLISAKHVYHLNKDSPDYALLEQKFLGVPEKDFERVRVLVNRLYPVLHTLQWRQLMKATGYGFPNWQKRVRMTLMAFEEM
jgi:hypothetical protein